MKVINHKSHYSNPPIKELIKSKDMKIYIASSWKNQHGVEMLTALLRDQGHEVISWIENNHEEWAVVSNMGFDKWVNSEGGTRSFVFDTDGATKCDLLIYYAPSGKDACAELGAAWGAGVPIIGLYAKGEDLGLMRRMMQNWYHNYRDLLLAVSEFSHGRILTVE